MLNYDPLQILIVANRKRENIFLLNHHLKNYWK